MFGRLKTESQCELFIISVRQLSFLTAHILSAGSFKQIATAFFLAVGGILDLDPSPSRVVVVGAIGFLGHDTFQV